MGRRLDRPRIAQYVSGRELGDEYRYILDRRSAKRYPNLLLDKPESLFEFRIRLIESERRMHAGFATKVHARKEKISQLGLELIVHGVQNWRGVRINGTASIQVNADLR